MDPVIVYDTTLRDGMQGEGMSLSVEEKVRVAQILDSLGVPMIEAGFPTSNPKELELFERLEQAGLSADVCAFGMTRRRGVSAEEDAALVTMRLAPFAVRAGNPMIARPPADAMAPRTKST